MVCHDAADPGLAKSLYHAVTDREADFPPVRDTRAEVVIIGAGFTGLSTALHLAEKGIDTIVLEAHDVGWGASGRNGGQVNPGLKSEPEDLIADFGEDRGLRLIDLAGHAPSCLFDLVKRYEIECAALNSGTIRVVRKDVEAKLIDHSVNSWRAHGVELRRLSRADIAAIAGTEIYPCGLLDPRGGQLNPLAYVRGLARVASRRGARIHTRSGVMALQRDGAGWQARTASGSVRASTVVLATNGYTDGLWPTLRKTVVPVYSALAATDPLPETLAARILPQRQVVYESSWRVLYFRVDDQRRFLMGGPSVLRATDNERDYQHLIAYARELYPALGDTAFTYFWNGQVAVTKDHYPHLHEPAPGVIAALGYNGRGVAMATVMGRIVARRILGAGQEDLELPITDIKPFTFHSMWKPVVTGRRIVGALRDRFL